MNENRFTVKDFYCYVISILETILNEVVMENPDATSVFPCIVAQAPMEFDEKTGETAPILSRYSITIEAWTNKKSNSVALIDKVDEILRKYNFTRIGTPIDLYDSITKKYRYGGNYEVFYNSIHNTLEKVK